MLHFLLIHVGVPYLKAGRNNGKESLKRVDEIGEKFDNIFKFSIIIKGELSKTLASKID